MATTRQALLERDGEVQAIAAALDAAGRRDGRLVVLEAAAGMGKTALLDLAVEEGDAAGFQLLRARAAELEHDLPFGVVRQLFARIAAGRELTGPAALAGAALGLAAPDPEADDPLGAALHGLHWLCTEVAERRPTVIAVDDLHWADVSSIRFVAYLARRLADLPILLIVATRPDEPGAAQDVLEVLIHDAGAVVLRPSPVSAEAAATLVRDQLATATAELCAACHTATGGNPFLIGELARELRDSGRHPTPAEVQRLGPRAVARSVLLRIGRLPAAAQRVAQAVALFPDGAEFRHVAALAEVDDAPAADAADELARAGVLAPGRPLTFLHPLMRTAVYEDLPPGARALSHARAAEILWAEEAPAPTLATHLVATEPGASPRTVELLRQAARLALGVGAPEAAVRYLERARDEPPRPGVLPAVLRELGAAAMLAGDDNAIEHLRAALQSSESGPGRAEIAYDLGRSLAFTNRHHEAVQAIDVAIAEIAADDPDRALRYHADALWIEWQADDLAEAFLRRLQALPRDLPGDTVAQQLVLCYQAWDACARLEPHERVADMAERAIAGGRIAALGLETAPTLSFAAVTLSAADRIAAALEITLGGLEACRAAGAVVALPLCHAQAAWMSITAGDLAAAERHALAGYDAVLSQSGQVLGGDWATASLLNVRVEQGRLDEAEAHVPSGPLELGSSFSVELILARARLRLAQGRLDEARSDLEAARRWAEAKGHVEAHDEVLITDSYALVLHRQGESEAARTAIATLVEQMRRFGSPGPLARALRVAGVVAADPDRLPLLEEAAELTQRSPRPLLRAKVLVDLGAALRSARRRADAREPLREALDLAARLGAKGLEARAAEELRATGGRVRRTALSGVDSLTPSEQRIVALAAQGRSNREIATELFLTIKTVEMHMGNSLRKLGISSRRDLPAALDPSGAP